MPVLLLLILAAVLWPPTVLRAETDWHSYADLTQARITHSSLDLQLDFDHHVITGTVTHRLDRPARALTLDTRDLEIRSVRCGARPATHRLGERDAVRGSRLEIGFAAPCRQVRIEYRTSPAASGLQWLSARMTAGARRPFFATQSWSIHARSWVPLQDTPRVRFTYEARVATQAGMLALMSAENPRRAAPDGRFTFKMRRAIPPQLLALAAGDLRFVPIGRRTGVYADPSLAAAAAREFAEAEQMVTAAEKICGPYRWGRFDILLLPRGAPYGGMENPRVTFVAESLLAGDKSLAGTIAHELAHSWAGNLVTNATWSDIWISEGFTTYLTNRIQEAVFGERRARAELLLSTNSLQRALPALPSARQLLHPPSVGVNPDSLLGPVPYVKGALLLHAMERRIGRPAMDEFLRRYFSGHAERSMSTGEVRETMTGMDRDSLERWLEQPGIPETPDALLDPLRQRIAEAAAAFRAGQSQELAGWLPQETALLLGSLQGDPSGVDMPKLEACLRSASSPLVVERWLILAMHLDYGPARESFRRYLENGRADRAALLSLFRESGRREPWRAIAAAWLNQRRDMLPPATVRALEKALG